MTDNTLIKVYGLTREFKTSESKPGFIGSILNLFSTKYTIKRAVDNVSFDIEPGEFVAYLGENGAGKSTTIKMLTGILTPTSGMVEVAGLVPYENRMENAHNIGVVFGQRTQLWWDLPVRESFDLLRSIFRVPDDEFEKTFSALNETLDLEPLLATPVRKLSLGQRMRCDLAAALLHSPPVLFLDEPTIGLDIIAKDAVRKFLKKVNQERGVTIILTTHDMDDIEALCDRIIILDEGKIAYDGSMDKLKREHVREKLLEIEFNDIGCVDIDIPMVEVVKTEANKRWFRFNQDKVTIQEVISRIIESDCVKDISIHEPKVEDIVKNIYANGASTLERSAR